MVGRRHEVEPEFLTRHNTPADGRGAVVALTAEGLRTLEEAAPLHVASVRRHFIDLLTPEQVEALAGLADSVVAHLIEAESR